ncbi:helix-hairpin-helix domain-containing protein [Candidatus Dependentiae bacterium]|nr:helix-hairpin-helix domain-containing protein [Candidatus Dependentiae bacterium]
MNNNNRKLLWIILLAITAGLLLFLKNNYFFTSSQSVFSDIHHNNNYTDSNKNNGIDSKNQISDNFIYIGIIGPVKNPGTYKIQKHITVKKLIELAGGLAPNADYDFKYDNIKIFESDTVIIPAKLNYNNYQNKFMLTNQNLGNLEKFIKKEHEIKKTFLNKYEETKKININSNDISELTKIPRIGPKTAETIIEFRKQHGDFKSVDDLTRVPRIGPKTFELIKEKVDIK